LVGHQKEHPACKNRVMRSWCGYLSAVRCKLFAYGPADATAIPKCHHLLPHLDPDWLSQLFLENRPLNGCSSSSSSSTCWVVCSDAAAGRKGEISVARVSETDYATLTTWFRVGISAFFAAIFLLQCMHLTWKTDMWTFVRHFAQFQLTRVSGGPSVIAEFFISWSVPKIWCVEKCATFWVYPYF